MELNFNLNFGGTRILFTSFILSSMRFIFISCFEVLFCFLSLTFPDSSCQVFRRVASTFSHKIVCWQLFDIRCLCRKNSSMLWSWATNETLSFSYRNYDCRGGRACYIIAVHFKLLNASCRLNCQCRKPLSLMVTFKLHGDSLCLGKETAMTEL